MRSAADARLPDVTPGRDAMLTAIEFVKGRTSAPIVLAVTVETKSGS